jgi:hypothetical protein
MQSPKIPARSQQFVGKNVTRNLRGLVSIPIRPPTLSIRSIVGTVDKRGYSPAVVTAWGLRAPLRAVGLVFRNNT